MKYTFVVLIAVLVLSCQSNGPAPLYAPMDIQGHRGARGLYPENSLEGFRAALDMGVSTLEMDLVMSKDAVVFVSHEPWMNADICIRPDGDRIIKEEEKAYNLFEFNSNIISNYDCGSLGNPLFPDQKKIKTHKPTLEEAVTDAEVHANETGRSAPNYNLEIKRHKGFDGVFHPEYKFFVIAVMHIVQKTGIENRTTIQCFDVETLEFLHERYPHQQLAYLVDESQEVEASLEKLTFMPEIYSPDFQLLDEKTVVMLQGKGMKVIPWTVNEREDIKRIADMGVDGIITDYPDRITNRLSEN